VVVGGASVVVVIVVVGGFKVVDVVVVGAFKVVEVAGVVVSAGDELEVGEMFGFPPVPFDWEVPELPGAAGSTVVVEEPGSVFGGCTLTVGSEVGDVGIWAPSGIWPPSGI